VALVDNLSKEFTFRVDVLKETGTHINMKENKITFADKYTFSINPLLKKVAFGTHYISD
jgi:hypothetical protein